MSLCDTVSRTEWRFGTDEQSRFHTARDYNIPVDDVTNEMALRHYLENRSRQAALFASGRPPVIREFMVSQ